MPIELEDSHVMQLRVPAELLERIEALRPRLRNDEAVKLLGTRVSRALACRLVLQRGVEALEAQADARERAVEKARAKARAEAVARAGGEAAEQAAEQEADGEGEQEADGEGEPAREERRRGGDEGAAADEQGGGQDG